MAETVKKATKTAAKPRKTASKKAAAAVTADPVAENHQAENHHATAQERAAAPERAVSHEEVARLAHTYWKERGHKHGHHEEDWYRAESELRGKAS